MVLALSKKGVPAAISFGLCREKVGRGERKIRLSGRGTANMVVTLFIDE